MTTKHWSIKEQVKRSELIQIRLTPTTKNRLRMLAVLESSAGPRVSMADVVSRIINHEWQEMIGADES